MKRTVKTVDGRKYIIEEFSNFNELIKTNDSRERNFGNARSRGDDDWCGATYEEAREMFLHGWSDEEKLKETNKKIADLEKLLNVPKTTFKNDIVGFAPVVPLALLGVPQNMIRSVRTPKKAKVINIIIDFGVSGGVSADQILEWGVKLTSKIIGIEKSGIKVRIDYAETYATDSSNVHVLKFPIKNENQLFDIKRLMYSMAHPSMERRISFDWYERCPEAEQLSGHGRPLSRHGEKSRAEIERNVADTQNSYLICCMDDIDKVLKEV